MTETAREDFKPSTPDEVRAGKTNMLIGTNGPDVVLRFPQPMPYVIFNPENARQVAEGLARAAYQARYGKPPADDLRSELAQDIRDRLTDELRDRMIARFTIVMPSMLEQLRGSKTPGRVAMELVDIFMREVTR